MATPITKKQKLQKIWEMVKMDFVMALSPLGFVLVGILFLKKGAMKVAPLTLLYTVIIAFSYFNINGLDFKSLVAGTDALLWKGVKEGAKIVMLVFSSFLLLNLMQRTGAIRQVQKTLASVTRDRRAQLVIVGMMVPIFLEGAAGAGSPAGLTRWLPLQLLFWAMPPPVHGAVPA